MYEFWYYYVKPKYSENAKLYNMDTDGFIVDVETDDIYKDMLEMQKQDLSLQILDQKDHCLKEKMKSNWINER